MRCPHCGYNSFAHLEHCKKCGREMKRSTSETEDLARDPVAVTGSTHAAGEEHSSTLDAGAEPGSVEIKAVTAAEPPSTTKVDETENTPDEEQEPALFDGFDFTSAPETEDEKEDEEPAPRSSTIYPDSGDDISANNTRFSVPPHPVDFTWHHSEDKISSPDPSPADASPLEKPCSPCRSALLGRRFLASVLDIVVIIGVWFLFYTWSRSLLWEGNGEFFALLLHSPGARGGFYLLLVLIALAYFILFHYVNGQTPGKILNKIRVVSCDAAPLTLTQVLLRTCGGFVSALFLGVGYIAIWWAPDARGWNDKLADTRVEATHAEDVPTAEYE